MSHNAKPFVKWVGGKRNISEKLLTLIPKSINNYYEPFLGGGAMFFKIYPFCKNCFLSDSNSRLIRTYQNVKNHCDILIGLLKEHNANHDKEYYYFIRSQAETDTIQDSANFIYLMKTCFNGLYRVNKKGFFNVPMGRYENPKICDEDNLLDFATFSSSLTYSPCINAGDSSFKQEQPLNEALHSLS